MFSKADLEYYVGRKVGDDDYEEALEWQEYHPDTDLSEYVVALRQIGGL